VGLLAGAAGAQNLEVDEMAAALSLPVITGGQRPNTLKGSRGSALIDDDTAVTLDTVTNGRSTSVLLRVDVISGDPADARSSDRWQSDSFDCLLKAHQTATFVFTPDGAGSMMQVTCATPLAASGPFADNKLLGLRAANGILFVAAADPATGKTISQDVLFGGAVVVDIMRGQVFRLSAIPFQAGTGHNDGNKVYSFDGQEYARFPAVLATNFIAPDPQRIHAELILFTLDGTTANSQAPRVALAGLGYNDDEAQFDFQWEFDCFDIVQFEDMSPNFTQDVLGSLSGHLQLVAQPVGTPGTDLHDAQFGDGNNSRRRSVHGWIIQSVVAGAPVVLPKQPTLNQGGEILAAGIWSRPLGQGRGSLVPFLNDLDPVFNAGPF
jgi:hypothetical protein